MFCKPKQTQSLSGVEIEINDLIGTSPVNFFELFSKPQLNDIYIWYVQVTRINDLRTVSSLRKANGTLVEVEYMIQSSFDPEMYNVAAIHPTKVISGDKAESDSAIEIYKYHDFITSESKLD